MISAYLNRCRIYYYNKKYLSEGKIHSSVVLGDVKIIGNVYINKNSYMNSGELITGSKSKIIIGKNCAISNNVRIRSETHDINKPTGKNMILKEKDIIIKDNVWIGSNVFIKEGITVGENSIIGANSIVTKDVKDNSIVGGVPAKLIRYKNG